MAKPRVFISSTYYDLRHIRAVLEAFVKQFGYDPILFEKGAIPFRHERSLEESCLIEVDACDILILIIGGRYGSMSKEDQDLLEKDPDVFYATVKSVTRKEYEKARERDVPVFIFVEAGVLSEYKTYQENRDKDIRYAHVDDKRIYEMLDDIYVQRTNNFVKGFSGHEDILDWLRQQWAGLFADALKKRQTETKLKNLESQIYELSNIVAALKSYSEEIVKTINKDGSIGIIAKVDKEVQRRQLEQFQLEDLILHVKDRIEGAPPSDERLLDEFLRSKSLKDFLIQVRFRPSEVDVLSSSSVAEKDFSVMKKRYGDDTGRRKKAAG